MTDDANQWPRWMVNAHGDKRVFASQTDADADGTWYKIGEHPLDRDADNQLGGSKPRGRRKAATK